MPQGSGVNLIMLLILHLFPFSPSFPHLFPFSPPSLAVHGGHMHGYALDANIHPVLLLARHAGLTTASILCVRSKASAGLRMAPGSCSPSSVSDAATSRDVVAHITRTSSSEFTFVVRPDIAYGEGRGRCCCWLHACALSTHACMCTVQGLHGAGARESHFPTTDTVNAVGFAPLMLNLTITKFAKLTSSCSRMAASSSGISMLPFQARAHATLEKL